MMAQEPQKYWEWEFDMSKFDSIKHEKIYRVTIENNQQVEIIKYTNGHFSGHLNQVIWTTNKKQERLKRISQKIKISDSIAAKLFNKFELNSFDSIPDSYEIQGAINGLDGTTTFFGTETKDRNKTVSFWELTNDYYYNKNIPNEIIQAQQIIKFINDEFNLENEYNKFISNLPCGRYMYSSLLMTKRNSNGC